MELGRPRGRGRSVAGALALALACACGGEGADDGGALGTEEAVAIAREHGGDVDAFERWARGIAASDTTFPSRAALEEAAFAPVRREDGVIGAWIAREGPDPWSLAHPRRAELPASLAWRTARLTGMREYEVARASGTRYVRARSETRGGAMLVVTLAFTAPATATERAPADER